MEVLADFYCIAIGGAKRTKRTRHKLPCARVSSRHCKPTSSVQQANVFCFQHSRTELDYNDGDAAIRRGDVETFPRARIGGAAQRSKPGPER